MPKLKRRSSAQCLLQAKKRKRTQREDPTKRLREQERNTAARGRIRQENPELRREEQERNTIGNGKLCVIHA